MGLFSNNEMARRLDKAQKVMAANGIDAIVINSVHNTLYYSGFWMVPWGRYQGMVIPREGEPAVIAPRIEFDRPHRMSVYEDVRIYWDTQSSVDGIVKIISDVLAERGIHGGVIGFEETFASYEFHGKLQSGLPSFSLKPVAFDLMHAQKIKSDEELNIMRHGGQICDIGAIACADALKIGVTEVELQRVMINAMELEICKRFPDEECDGTFAWFQSGPVNTTVAHALNTNRKVERGDVLSLNVFPMIVGYYHLLERSLVMGPMSDEVRKYFEIEVEVHHSGISALKPGIRLGDIDDQFITPIYRKHGLEDARTFGTGHSFGIMHYWFGRDEIGEIRPYNDTILEPGMVLSIEPMISIEGVGGFKHADMFIVNEDGIEQLTNYDNGVIVIDP
ncbi:aminopeptidase P family protein [Alphaproteobacteria bacterium]|nr:aminopeptidase P family protein [Alphaproteobacteria bacterium]